MQVRGDRERNRRGFLPVGQHILPPPRPLLLTSRLTEGVFNRPLPLTNIRLALLTVNFWKGSVGTVVVKQAVQSDVCFLVPSADARFSTARNICHPLGSWVT